MTFKKGTPKPPTSGRRPGVVNKKSLLVRDVLEENGINLVKLILGTVREMSPTDRADVLLRLMPYVYPTLSATQININTEENRQLREVSDATLNAILLEAEPTDK
jgi:hypothetical protein